MEKADLQKLSLPDAPGVYIFRDARSRPLYVGKAASLRDRVRSYFANDLIETRSPAIAGMVKDAAKLTWQETESVLEALILEANLIKRYSPRFNIADKDNKSFNYLVITKEEYPRVLVVRGRDLFTRWSEYDIKHLFGPYPKGGSLKEAVHLVRKIFTFRDKCEPHSGKPCFNAQIGLCPGVCTGTVSKREYGRTMRNITLLFSGKMATLRKKLQREMKQKVKEERFEEAVHIRRQLDALAHIRDVSLIKDEHRIAAGGALRIEAYDIAHTAGAETVGVMAVVVGGEPAKSEYRMFKIQSVTNNDVAALKEVLTRRLRHTEWQMPRVIAVDGGKAQLRAAEKVLENVGVSIPVVGVVKNEAHKPERLIGDEKAVRLHAKSILIGNSEAHRFAINYHQKRRRKRLF